MEEKQQEGARKGEIDGAGCGSLFRVHGAEDVVAQEEGVKDDESGGWDDGEPPVVEEYQYDPNPHTCADVDKFSCEVSRVVLPFADSF